MPRDRVPDPEVPPDLLEALRGDPPAQAAFTALAPSHRRAYIDWITEARKPETRSRRIAGTLGRLRGATGEA